MHELGSDLRAGVSWTRAGENKSQVISRSRRTFHASIPEKSESGTVLPVLQGYCIFPTK